MLTANDDTAALFREMIGDVERNYATQVNAALLSATMRVNMTVDRLLFMNDVTPMYVSCATGHRPHVPSAADPTPS